MAKKIDYYWVAIGKTGDDWRLIPMSDDEDRNLALHLCDGEHLLGYDYETEEDALKAIREWRKNLVR